MLWIALDNTFSMRSLTWRANYSARGGGVAEGTSRGKNAKKHITTATRVEGARKKNEFFSFFKFYLDIRHLKLAYPGTRVFMIMDGRSSCMRSS